MELNTLSNPLNNMRQYKDGTWLFDQPNHYRFKYAKYKIIGESKNKNQKKHLHVGDIFHCGFSPLVKDGFYILDNILLDGLFFYEQVEKIQEPDDFWEYFKTINPDILRKDYKEAYFKLKEIKDTFSQSPSFGGMGMGTF